MPSAMLPLLTALLLCTTNCALAYSIIQYRQLKCMIPRLSRDTPRFDVSSSRSSSYSAFNTRSKYINAALRVSLDQSVLPKSRLSFRLGWIMAVAVAAVIVSIFRIARRKDESSSYSDVNSDSRKKGATTANSFDDLSTNFRALFTMVVFAPIKFVASWLRVNNKSKHQTQQQSKKTKPMNLDIWNVCRLANIKKLGDQYSRYRFDVTSYPDGEVPLDIGQELVLCSVDSRGRTLKEGFIPVSDPKAKGYFEILICNEESITSGTPFSLALQFMSVGDEVAVKAGKRLLKYRGTDDPITAISLLASGQGIATAYRILNEILNDPESTVEEVNLVWINEKKKDFVLNSDIEELETRCLDRLQVIRVVDISANNPDTVINDQLKNFMTQYSAGKLVLSCASDVIRVKVGSMLQELGYPDTNVISINTVPPPIAPMKDNKMITN